MTNSCCRKAFHCLLSVISGAGSAPGGSSSLSFRFHMVRNHSCCTATANCPFAPYLSIYTLVALVSYIDQNAIFYGHVGFKPVALETIRSWLLILVHLFVDGVTLLISIGSRSKLRNERRVVDHHLPSTPIRPGWTRMLSSNPHFPSNHTVTTSRASFMSIQSTNG